MPDWQGSDPRSTRDAMEAMDNRQSRVGNTLVFSDRYGPYKFMRGGVEVPCVCDGDTMCAYHAGSNVPDSAKAKPVTR